MSSFLSFNVIFRPQASQIASECGVPFGRRRKFLLALGFRLVNFHASAGLLYTSTKRDRFLDISFLILDTIGLGVQSDRAIFFKGTGLACLAPWLFGAWSAHSVAVKVAGGEERVAQ
jgi:hypothetical protein